MREGSPGLVANLVGDSPLGVRSVT